MGYTAEQQRVRNAQKRCEEHGELVKCLECGLYFVRVGSHVTQVHGYNSAREYFDEHGLAYKEGSTEEYRARMSRITKANGTEKYLESGAKYRFKKGGDHPKNICRFWALRRKNRTL